MKFLTHIRGYDVISFVFGFIASIYLVIFAPAKYFLWHALEKPPEPITELVSATITTITVRTIGDNKFSCNIYVEAECWNEVDYVPTKGRLLWCFPEDNSAAQAVQIEKACNQSHDFGIIGTIFSLNKNGNIYVKHKGYIGTSGYFLGIFFGLLFAIMVHICKQLLWFGFSFIRKTISN